MSMPLSAHYTCLHSVLWFLINEIFALSAEIVISYHMKRSCYHVEIGDIWHDLVSCRLVVKDQGRVWMQVAGN
jgi:hypothetical protein